MYAEPYKRIFKIRNGNGNPLDYFPVFLYRTSWGYPLVNSTPKKMRYGEKGRYIIVNTTMPNAEVVLKACQDWLRLHLFESEDESLDYAAVKCAVNILTGTLKGKVREPRKK